MKKRLTIERQLEKYCKRDTFAERNAVLWHAWCQNKRWFSQLLETTLGSFPTYSRHDESHAQTVLHNIEMILGEERIKELSASDCFMILHTVYIHDIGMVITYSDRKAIVQNEKFQEMVEELSEDNDNVFKRSVRALEQTEYNYGDEISKSEQKKKLYDDKLNVYYAILHLLANFRRSEHGDISEKRLKEWTLDSEKLGAGFSMAGIPQRIFILIAQCAGLHTDSDFEHIMELPQEDNGYVSDYLHPRFIAVLLQLGDILDMDNDRFHPLTKECIGDIPEISERHFLKHQSIRKLYIRPDIISIEADCGSQDALRLVRKECDMLKDILRNASYNWMLICPANFSGALPALDSVALSLNGTKIPEKLVATQFCISQKKAFAILEGSNVYEDRFVFLREFLQNAIDASKMQYWHECVRTWGYYTSREELGKMSPEELEKMLSTDLFPIEIKMQMVMRNENQKEKEITKDEIERLKAGGEPAWEYGVKVYIKDFGTGIDKESILNIAKVGGSRKREQNIIKEMPQWLMPTAEFGIGLQSAFILTNMFKCRTYTRSNEKYEITFSTVKSNYYEGYINVQPLEEVETFGTCFEVFVPISKKLSHELYPSAWNGQDYFDEDYEVLRPVRHTAELLAQMALYLDQQIGEQLFPIRLNVEQVEGITIPLNQTEKNKLRRLRYNERKKEKYSIEDEKIMELIAPEGEANITEKLFGERVWERCGKSWIYYLDSNEQDDLLKVQTAATTAIIDCRNGHLYFWDNDLCIFCTVNMENFLQLEKQQMETPDKKCENVQRNVRIYYKGINLEEAELPDLGNELIQYIDIKGRLERENINLNRKGLTEQGKIYFMDKIYFPLLKSIQSTLKKFNKSYKETLKEQMKKPLVLKKSVVEKIDNILMNPDELNPILSMDQYIRMNREVAIQQIDEKLAKIQNEILINIRQEIISDTMLSFLAQKEVTGVFMGSGFKDSTEQENNNYWKTTIEMIREYSKWIQEREETREENNESLLFHIWSYKQTDLMKSEKYFQEEKLNFVDIFSEDNKFMIISNRQHASAPWKQFLIPISQKTKDNPIEIIEKYIMADNISDETKRLSESVKIIEKNMFLVAQYCKNSSVATDRMIETKEYRQQYIIKWLLRYIPTIAVFMSKDGNTRINIIHGKSFPILYVNDYYKMSIIKRVMDDMHKYHIERFSIPTWQKFQLLRCEKLPYAHYFVKRGFMSKDSYGKTIFPFGKNELQELYNRINSNNTKENILKMKHLYVLLNASRYMVEVLLLDKEKIKKYISNIQSTLPAEKDVNYIEEYEKFVTGYIEKISIKDYMYLVDKIREQYVKLIRFKLQQKENVKPFKLADLEEYQEKWEQLYVCILLNVIGNRNGITTQNLIIDFDEEVCDSIVAAWKYLLDKSYLNDISEIAKYEEEYMEELENENSSIYRKQRSIVEFIQKNNGRNYPMSYIWECWSSYVKELFLILEQVEIEEVASPEENLDDYLAMQEKLN